MPGRAGSAVDRCAEALAAAIFGLIVCIALIQVFCRYVINYSLSWSEEAQIFGHIWIVFLGIPIAYRRGAHLYIETFCDKLPPGPRSVFNLLLAIALVGYVGIAAVPGLVLPLFAQKMFAQLDSFTLLALPYFILAGALMSASGMSKQLVDFSRVLVGHLRAGLAHASVVACMVFAGVSGSSTADASAISAIVIPTMKQSGYKPGFAAALIATAGTIGAIIPPSMTMVVYGSIAQVSIGGLFLGGIIPGIMVGLFLMAAVKIYTYLPGYPELRVTHGRFNLRALGRS